MAEKKFVLESSSDLQRIGLRAQIISFLVANGVREGNALNDPENKRAVIVALRAEDTGIIEQIRIGLVKHLNSLHESDSVCYEKFPTDITASELMGLDNPHIIRLLPLSNVSDSLMLEQTSKGVGALLALSSSIIGLNKAIMPLAALQSLPAAIERLERKLA